MADDEIVELNVGGVVHATRRATLCKVGGSRLAKWFAPCAESADGQPIAKDAMGRWFIDRDGALFKYILDALRENGEQFTQRKKLQMPRWHCRRLRWITRG